MKDEPAPAVPRFCRDSPLESSFLILPPSSLFALRISGDFDVAAALSHFNVIELQRIGYLLNSRSADCRGRVLPAHDYRGHEECHLVDYATLEHQSRQERS